MGLQSKSSCQFGFPHHFRVNFKEYKVLTGEEAIVPMFYTATLVCDDQKASMTGYALSGIYENEEDEETESSGGQEMSDSSDFVGGDVDEEFAARFSIVAQLSEETDRRESTGSHDTWEDEVLKDIEGVKLLLTQ